MNKRNQEYLSLFKNDCIPQCNCMYGFDKHDPETRECPNNTGGKFNFSGWVNQNGILHHDSGLYRA